MMTSNRIPLPRVFVWMALAVSTLVVPSLASGQNLAYLAMGGRTGNMGGTGVAFGNDGAMGLLNPAGIAGVDRDTLSLSLSVYSVERSSISDFFAQPQPPSFQGVFQLEGNDLSSSVARAIPTSFAYFFHFGEALHQVVGFSVLSPRSIQREFDGTLRIDGAGVFGNEGGELVDSQRTYYFGPSYALEHAQGDLELRGGASVYLAYSTLTRYLSSTSLSGTVPTSSFVDIVGERYESGTSFDLAITLGGQVKYGRFRVGVTVQPPSFHIGGDLSISATAKTSWSGVFANNPDLITTAFFDGDYEQALPLRVSGGIAVELGSALLAVDVTYVGSLEYDRFSGTRTFTTLTEGQNPENGRESFATPFRQGSVINVGVGAEIALSEATLLRLGGFTDFSATEYPEPEERNIVDAFDERIDRYGATVGMAMKWGESETTFGFTYVRGIGEIVGFDSGNFDNPTGVRLVDIVTNTFAASVAGSVDIASVVD